jgi:hypothetical protein
LMLDEPAFRTAIASGIVHSSAYRLRWLLSSLLSLSDHHCHLPAAPSGSTARSTMPAVFSISVGVSILARESLRELKLMGSRTIHIIDSRPRLDEFMTRCVRYCCLLNASTLSLLHSQRATHVPDGQTSFSLNYQVPEVGRG